MNAFANSVGSCIIAPLLYIRGISLVLLVRFSVSLIVEAVNPYVMGHRGYETYKFNQRQEEVYKKNCYHNEPELTIGTEYSENIYFFIYDFKLTQNTIYNYNISIV